MARTPCEEGQSAVLMGFAAVRQAFQPDMLTIAVRLESLTVRRMLDILYDSGPCLVVNKPPGVLTQAPAGIDSLEVRVKEFYREREQKEGNIYLGLPHRLDRPVSGAIVFARHVRAAQRLATQFENRTVTKVYWAFVEGDVQPDEGTWTDHLHKRHGMAQAIVVPADDPRGKLAVMHYRVLARIDGRRHLARSPTRNRPHAPDPRAGRVARPSGCRRRAVRRDAAVRRAIRGRAAAGDRAARPPTRLQSPDDGRAGGCIDHCAVSSRATLAQMLASD